MDARSVDVNPGNGRAVYQASHLPMADYHDLGSQAAGVTPLPGVVSFKAEWAKSNDKHHYRYAPHRWEGHFVQNTATAQWSGRTAAAEFITNTVNPSIFAEVGHEKSGVFFS